MTNRRSLASSDVDMIKHSIHKLCAVAVLAGVAGVAPVQADDDEMTPLAKEMDEIAGALKGLRRLKRSPDRWTASAEAIRKVLPNAEKCIPMVPREIEALPDGPEKTKALADSRRYMGMMYVALCELELAFLNEDEDAVEAAIDKCNDIKKESHDKYYKDE